MSASEQQATLARLQARQKQLKHELKQVERQMVAARLQIVTVEQRNPRLTRSQRSAA